MPPSPARGWQRWAGVIGPGVLLAGASIGSGEWLFGPAVTATYGGTMLWLATLSILGQVFCNLEMIRYTLYCGEPIIVGYFRTRPGPRFWTFWFALLDVSSIWPFNVSNAAVVAAAAFLGHLPQEGVSASFLGLNLTEDAVVKVLAFTLFLLAFLPLIFGGTIYRMLLRIFTFKLFVVLVYLIVFAVLTVSASNAWEVLSGSLRFGRVPLKADTVVVERHFRYRDDRGNVTWQIQGTLHEDRVNVTSFSVKTDGKTEKFSARAKIPERYLADCDRLIDAVRKIARKGKFVIEDYRDEKKLTIEGSTDSPQEAWTIERVVIPDVSGPRVFDRLEDLPEPEAERARALVAHQGVQEVNVFSYLMQYGRLPAIDWATLAAFAGIAGAGGMTNVMYSSFARDKGWGMGARVGAIPSLIGGRTITLSHVGEAFRPDETSRPRWRGWMRYIVEDQMVVWMLCNIIGFALPCMLSLQFIRHAPIADTQVAAQIAEGMQHRYPGLGNLLWFLTLFVGFLVLYPGQILAGDILARRWTDIIWTSNPVARRMEGHQVKYVYYGILALYCVWGLIALWLFKPLMIAKIGAVLMNLALGSTALHSLYVNKTLLPPELRPNWFMQLGVIFCGLFFLGITAIVVLTL
ncbi:MAG TPA: Nramp family divalent metal transporter [Planctomycetaceae bacterium]|nr:Nramp family divalent metal transporter [Planctomycetaceae bacterium]